MGTWPGWVVITVVTMIWCPDFVKIGIWIVHSYLDLAIQLCSREVQASTTLGKRGSPYKCSTYQGITLLFGTLTHLSHLHTSLYFFKYFFFYVEWRYLSCLLGELLLPLQGPGKIFPLSENPHLQIELILFINIFIEVFCYWWLTLIEHLIYTSPFISNGYLIFVSTLWSNLCYHPCFTDEIPEA